MDIAALGIAIDSSGALKAANDLNLFVGSAAKAEKSAGQFSVSVDRAAASSLTVANATRQVAASFAPLAVQINKTAMSEQQLAAEAARTVQAMKSQTTAAQALSREIADTTREFIALNTWSRASAQAANAATTGYSKVGSAAINASFQVQDLAVQIASGQSAMTAFAQQAPQFLSAFGVSGKLALYGSLMGTAVAVTAAIVPHLISGAEAGRSLDDVMGDLADSVDSYADAIEASNAPLDELIEKYGRAAISARALLREEQELRRVQAMQELNSGAGKIAGEVQDIFGGMSYRSASWTRELAEDLEISIDQMARLLDLNRQLEGAQGPQAQAAAAAEMRNYFLEVYGTVDNIPPRLLDIYSALIDSGQAAMQFQSLTEQAGTTVVAMGTNAASATIEVWSMSDAASGLAGYFNAANAATGGLLGTLQSAARAAWDLAQARVAGEQAAKQIAASQTNMDPLGAFSGGQGSAMRVQVAAGGTIRTPTAPTLSPSRAGGGGGRRKRSGGGASGGEAFDPFADLTRDTELLERQISVVGKSEAEVARLQARWEAFDRIQKEGITLTPEMTARIEQQAAQVGSLTQQLADQELAWDRFNGGVDKVSGTMADVALGATSLRDALAQTFRGIAADLMTSGIRQAIMSQFSGTGGGSGLFGSLLGGIFGAMDPLAGALRGAGLNAIPSFDGGGWTGSGPRSGGLDNKGGFLALMHPGERVQDTTKGQGGSMHVSASIDQNGNLGIYVQDEFGRMMAQAGPQIVNRSVGATRRAMGKSKRGWGI